MNAEALARALAAARAEWELIGPTPRTASSREPAQANAPEPQLGLWATAEAEPAGGSAEAHTRRKAHVAHNTGKYEWYTPAGIIEAAREVMGGIDLDPASCDAAQAVVKAERYFTEEQDGLVQPWSGRLWMNPPYAQPLITNFCYKLVHELDAGHVEQAIALTNNGTDTAWGQLLYSTCSAVCLPKGRVRFWAPDKKISAPLQGQMITYFGPATESFVHHFSPMGTISFPSPAADSPARSSR